MVTLMELRARGIVPYPKKEPSSIAQPLSLFTACKKADESPTSPQADLQPPHRTEISDRYMLLEPSRPLMAVNDDPVFDMYAAARILGCSHSRLKKWRQRDQGPDYIQYGENGAVRYELSALMAFRAAHKVRVGAKP